MSSQKWRIFFVSVTFFSVFTYAAISMSQPLSFADLLSHPTPQATTRLAYGTHADQFGELWLPDSAALHPVIVMIHGGCWQASLPGVVLMAYIADDMRSSGFAVWNIEYRRLGTEGAGYPGTFLDVANGIDYLRSIAPTYHLDLRHITIVGHSAGGQLALWAAARGRVDIHSKLYSSNPLPINFVVTLAGINDLKDYHDNGPDACGGPSTIDQLTGDRGRLHQDPYADTSPAALLPLHVKQLVVAGDLDPIVPKAFAIRYATLAKDKGDDVAFLDIRDAGHFELIAPLSHAWIEIKQRLMAP